jgi:phosphopantothenoylcysteine decarboxylase / phosphopantothenate---cysteine ligase
MSEWNFSPPPESSMGDHDVPREGHHLEGKRIALVVTGGIAAFKTPMLARALRKQGAEVVAYLSDEGARYVAEEALCWATTNPVVTRLTPAAEHLADARPFDAWLVAPATANTINKLAWGIADTPVTSALASALGRQERGQTKLLVAPTMHGSLHTSILTEALRRLDTFGVQVITPREGYGKHNLPADDVLVAETCRAVSTSSLRDVPVLVTGGPTPVPLDNVRRIVNRFRGRLGALVCEELYLRGAAVHLIHGDGAYHPPEHLPFTVARTYDDYRRLVHEALDARPYRFGVFSAGVADYRPAEVLPGKTPSQLESWSVQLVPTAKVIDEVRARHPELYMVTFKYLEGVTFDELLAVARERIDRGYPAIVANLGEEMGAGDEQTAYLVTGPTSPIRWHGKREIARGIADHLEEELGNEG